MKMNLSIQYFVKKSEIPYLYKIKLTQKLQYSPSVQWTLASMAFIYNLTGQRKLTNSTSPTLNC